MKRIMILFMAVMMIFSFAACGGEEVSNPDGIPITDSDGKTVYLTKDSRIVSCYASLSQCWVLAGGELVGVTDDCEERGMVFENGITIIGSTKTIDMEKVVSLNPDYVILSADLTAQRELRDMLEDMNIPYGYFREDTFEDYKNIMSQFTAVTGRDDLYETNVTAVEKNIKDILSKIPADNDKTALLLRAYSTGMKAKRDDNLAGQILNEYHLTNIADIYPSLMEDMSMEKIVEEDPDYIFVTTMGDEDAAREYLLKNIETDPVWRELSAVKNGRYIILPQEYFHYKPNEEWDVSYEILAKIIYPEIFS